MYNLTVNEATFVIVDLETTGFSPKENSVIEVAGIKYQGGMIIGKFSQLVKPKEEFLFSHITELTGITNSMVIDKPYFEDIYPEFYKFIKDSILVGHNIKFDYSFLNETHKFLYKKDLKLPSICTDNLARRIFPELRKKSLEYLANYLGINFYQKHRAMSDAEATLKAFQVMLNFLQDYNINKVIDIIRLSQGKQINKKNKTKRYV
ncbi:3'-5' exonuclease [Hydrogenothermus marinus]|uniref:DNA polymerase-3 subunit epsilon n=1 Tax=Hydrogenothermus marinus TaxID=133270 RepID=A0A3M0BK50_9AQUI|nr:3'-5' exonuclease [Hydrogenothermus marinus]RMA97581.1 DNA polymerase-3 subunit epsilon [Hydrogenothermus marinus]